MKNDSDARELTAFRKIVAIEKKLGWAAGLGEREPVWTMDSLEDLKALMRAYQATGQEAKRIEVMRRLRDIDIVFPKPVPAKVSVPSAPSVDESRTEELYRRALEVIRTTQRASIAHLQRRMGIGYATAARLIDLLEDRGIIGPAQGRSRREILKG